MNATKTAMIAKSKVKQNGPTFCNIDGRKVDRNKQIHPKPAENSTHHLFYSPTKIEGPEVSDWYNLMKIEKSTEADALINEIECVQYIKDNKRAITRVAAGIDSPVVFPALLYIYIYIYIYRS